MDLRTPTLPARVAPEAHSGLGCPAGLLADPHADRLRRLPGRDARRHGLSGIDAQRPAPAAVVGGGQHVVGPRLGRHRVGADRGLEALASAHTRWRGRFSRPSRSEGVTILDLGPNSPILVLLFLPLVYAALMFTPKAAALCGLSALASAAVVATTDSHGAISQERSFMFFAVLAGASVLSCRCVGESESDRTTRTAAARDDRRAGRHRRAHGMCRASCLPSASRGGDRSIDATRSQFEPHDDRRGPIQVGQR